MDTPRPDVTDVLEATRELHAAMELLFDAVAERYGINRTDLRCLEILQRKGATRAHHLAELSGLSPAAITKILDRLEAAGYVSRRPSATDRRAQVIETSAHHTRLREATWSPLLEEVTAVLEPLPATRLNQMADSLHRLASVHRTHADDQH